MEKSLKEDIFQWDIDNWSLSLDIWEPILQLQRGRAISFGEREGGLSLLLALNQFEVTCTDYVPFRETPLPIHIKHDKTSSIHYEQQDITAVKHPDESFDIVVFKSVVGALGDPERIRLAFQEIHRILKPGGYLLFAENLKASKLHRFARKKFTAWGHRWYYPSIAEITEFTNLFSDFRYETFGTLGAFGRSEKQRQMVSEVDQFINKTVPNSWNYILAGVARK